MPYDGTGGSNQMNGPPQAQQMPPHQMGGHYGYPHRVPQQPQMGHGGYNHMQQQGGNQQGMPPPAPSNAHHRGSMPPMNMNMGGCAGKLKFQQQTQQPAACYK